MWPSIALDSHNNPHISYVDNSRTALKYATRTDSGWNIQTIGYTPNDFPSIAVDSEGYPHISFDDNALKIASWNGVAWNIQTVDSSDAVYRSDIALDSHNNPHISYIDAKQHEKYAVRTGSSWSIETLDSSGRVAQTSTALDSGGNPHVTYSKLVPGQVISRYFYNLTYATVSESYAEGSISFPELLVLITLALLVVVIISVIVLKRKKRKTLNHNNSDVFSTNSKTSTRCLRLWIQLLLNIRVPCVKNAKVINGCRSRKKENLTQ